MALHRVDPLGVDHPAAEHPPRFILQVADPGSGRVGVVAEELARIAAGQCPHGRNHATMVLHVVVTVEDIVFPGVLVLRGYYDLAEPLPELGPGTDSKVLLGVGVATPGGIDLSQVFYRFPVPLVQRRQDAGPVGAGFAAEDTI